MIKVADNAKGKLSIRDCLILAGLIGLVTGIISIYVSILSGSDASDFKNILVPAREWLAGKDIYLPYKLNIDPFSVPYPFTPIYYLSHSAGCIIGSRLLYLQALEADY